MNNKTIWIIVGICVLVLVGIFLGWYVAGVLVGGGGLAMGTKLLLNQSKEIEEKNKLRTEIKSKIDKARRKYEEKITKIEEQHKEESKLPANESDDDRNDRLDTAAKEFLRSREFKSDDL